jgi:hypothetical protein
MITGIDMFYLIAIILVVVAYMIYKVTKHKEKNDFEVLFWMSQNKQLTERLSRFENAVFDRKQTMSAETYEIFTDILYKGLECEVDKN